ncbi:MAG: SufD family Fe-S cluster assembly protein [Candidatus Peregrinibacteria bacterium]|nr:SufD family Fe-S cluster assembly protein [Candidatus Peregrinibacteria bacterium]
MITKEEVLALSSALGETDFLKSARLRAFEAFIALPPTKSASLELPITLPTEQGEGTGLAFSTRKEMIAGIFGQMRTGDINEEHKKFFEEKFASLLPQEESPETLRHYAFLSLGFFLYVPPGITLKEPVRLTYTNRHEWAATHIVIIVGKGSKVTFVEELYNDLGGIDRPAPRDAKGFWSHVTEVFVGEDAELEFVSLELSDPGERLWIQQRSSVGSGAKISWRNATLGGAAVSHDLKSAITGSLSESTVDWMFYARGTERYDLSVRNTFDAREGSGEITMKGVAEDRAHVRSRGMIEIGEGGQGTDTYLTQNVLMLDPTSKVDVVPGLEIRTNDVKASHSATVTRVTVEDLFYFAARGIPEREARSMYVQGFLGDLTSRIAHTATREQMQRAVQEKYEEQEQ